MVCCCDTMKVLKIYLCRPLIEDDDEKEDERDIMEGMLVPEFDDEEEVADDELEEETERLI